MFKQFLFLVCLAFSSGAVSAAPILTGLSIGGPAFVISGETTSYIATATFSDGSTQTVAANWIARCNGTVDAATGALTAGPLTEQSGVRMPAPVLLAAIYSSGGITQVATKHAIIGPSSGAVNTVAVSCPGTVLLPGWNLLGNTNLMYNLAGTVEVAAVLGEEAKVQGVWKWAAPKNKWAFYTPTQADGGAAYAASKGYEFLTTIDYGEGFWVNAKTAHIAPFGASAGLPIPAPVPSGYQLNLVSGWNLIATAEPKTPSQFNASLSATPPAAGEIPINLHTLWAWDAGQSNWYFYAPSLEAQGGTALADYVASKNYLDFGAKVLEPAMGFWVNKASASSVPAFYVQSSLQRSTSPAVPDSDKSTLAADNTAFALDVYRELLTDPARSAANQFFSPLSISVALAMTYAGAKGPTAAEMASALRFTLAQERLHPAFDWLDLELMSRGQGALGKDGQPFRLRVSNSLWGDAKTGFESPFLDTLAANYGAGMNLVDFRANPEPSRIRINDWVADKTEQRITNIIPQGAIDPLTRLVLVNAVYFNAAWQRKFDVDATVSEAFTKLDGSTTQVAMMNQMWYFPYAAGNGYQALELPYDGSELGMVLILPDAGGFEPFEKSLDANAVRTILASLKSNQVRLGLPKFRIEGESFSVKATMQKLGMKLAFSDTEADFSGMSTQEYLYIADILHKSFVEIDENGTEAAAATAGVGTTGATGSLLPPKIVKMDRPFLFAIVDKKTGAIVFWGRVVDPTL